jgi:hypothetical protein
MGSKSHFRTHRPVGDGGALANSKKSSFTVQKIPKIPVTVSVSAQKNVGQFPNIYRSVIYQLANKRKTSFNQFKEKI